MKDITIIVPVHALNGDKDRELFRTALDSVKKAQEKYTDSLVVMAVGPSAVKSEVSEIMDEMLGDTVKRVFQTNKGATDFCSQINCGAKHVKTDHFSILEFDDEYVTTWFDFVKKYYLTHEDVSVFLPIVVQGDENSKQYCNEVVWAMAFSNELGFIDEECLANWPSFNLDGAVFSTKDFNLVGGYNAEIKLVFNYELLIRMCSQFGLKAYVVPRIGYGHLLGREGSLLNQYNETMNDTEAMEWFAKAKASFVKKNEEE